MGPLEGQGELEMVETRAEPDGGTAVGPKFEGPDAGQGSAGARTRRRQPIAPPSQKSSAATGFGYRQSTV